jgi:ring-1,2-phenylacetyl-CoA epoxidase subunit PaaC
MDASIKYYLEIADNALILSHRLSENCSRGPFLEEDLACTNVALDLIGMAESIYGKVAELEGKGRSGDDWAYRRSEAEYRNSLLAEQPNTDFAYIMVRQFFMDAFHYYFFAELRNSTDAFLQAIAAKSLKEITYHLKRSSEWMIRFGLGTDVSHAKATAAIDAQWRYTAELFKASKSDLELRESGVSIDLNHVKSAWDVKVNEIFYFSTLKKPENEFQMGGGKKGVHSEHMGYLLCEMQYLTNKYPEAIW